MSSPETVPDRSRVTRLDVQRVYNLGNYENLRVGVTVEVGEGDDPGKLLGSLQAILGDLRAKSGVSEWDLRDARRELAMPEPPETDEVGRRNWARAQATVAKHETAMRRRDRARAALSTLEYTSEHRDAKDAWDDAEDY